jgi:6-phosphogluconolactonase
MKNQLGIIVSLLLILSGCSRNSGGSADSQQRVSRFVYVLNAGEETISQFKTGSDGQLEPLSMATVATGGCPRSMVMNKQGTRIYVGNFCSDTISQFQVGTNGELTEIASPIAASPATESLVLSPDGRFLYSTSLQDASIDRYQIATDGSLTAAGATSHPDVPVNLVFSPSGAFAYVVNLGISDLTQYSVAEDGSLNPLTPTTVPSLGCPSGPLGISEKNGTGYIYALSCATDQIETFKITQDGTLNSQGVVATGLYPTSFAVTNSNVYTTNLGDSTVSVFNIQEDGNLLASSASSALPDGTYSESIKIDNVNKEVYVLDVTTDRILRYKQLPDGSLSSSPEAVQNTGISPIRLIIK